MPDRDARPWGEHQAYLDELLAISHTLRGPALIAGDFNQRLPRGRQPKRVVESLQQVPVELRCVTEGLIPPLGKQAIDHIALSPDLDALGVRALDNRMGEAQVSDHFGLQADLLRKKPTPVD